MQFQCGFYTWQCICLCTVQYIYCPWCFGTCKLCLMRLRPWNLTKTPEDMKVLSLASPLCHCKKRCTRQFTVFLNAQCPSRNMMGFKKKKLNYWKYKLYMLHVCNYILENTEARLNTHWMYFACVCVRGERSCSGLAHCAMIQVTPSWIPGHGKCRYRVTSEPVLGPPSPKEVDWAWNEYLVWGFVDFRIGEKN